MKDLTINAATEFALAEQSQGRVVVFSNGMEERDDGSSSGLLSLCGVGRAAKACGYEVVHCGYGIFTVRGMGQEVAWFEAGGAMVRGADYSYSHLHLSPGAGDWLWREIQRTCAVYGSMEGGAAEPSDKGSPEPGQGAGESSAAPPSNDPGVR